MKEQDVYDLSARLGQVLLDKELLCSVAESCTGGYLSKVITDVPGSSAWFDRGFITYSNAAKSEMLDVKDSTLEKFGAVSCETALEMAEGLITHSRAQVSAAITGIAGPGGGSIEKPVGTVFFAWGTPNGVLSHEMKLFTGDRAAIRLQAVDCAIRRLLQLL